MEPSAQLEMPPSPAPQTVPRLEPCAIVPVPPGRCGDAMGGPVLFDTKHSLMYVRALDSTPHGWGLARWYAPDVSTLVLVAVLIWGFVRIRRVVRQPQSLGAWYCRRCNYELADAAAKGLCPECGGVVGPSKVRRGKSTRRRLSALTLLVVPIVTMSVGGLVWGLQRFSGGPFESRPWPTNWMGYLGTRWLFSKPLTVGRAQYAWRTNRYIAVHLPDGASAGPELPIVPGCNYGYVLSEDGRWLGTMTEVDSDGHIELVAYDTKMGITKQTAVPSAGAPKMYQSTFQIQASGITERRFASDEGRFGEEVREWKPSLYSINLAADGPAMVENVASASVPPGHVSFAVLPRGGEVVWAMLSFGIDGNGGLTRPTEVISLDEQGRIRAAPLSQAVMPGWYPRLKDDGATLELEDDGSWLTYRVRVSDGAVSLACARHRELAFFSPSGVTVYLDENGEFQAAMDGQAPFATLKVSGGQVLPSGISSDGRWVAALRFGRRRAALCPDCVPAVRTDDVVVWDLKDVLPYTGTAPSSP